MDKPDIFGTGASFVSLDEIEDAFNTPTQRQDYYEPKPDTDPGTGDLSHLADPDGSANEPEPETVDAETVVDHDHAQRTGERIARLIDTGIDFTLSNFVARNGESYRADERDLQDIAECWGELAEEKGWSIGPEWSLVILYIMVYGPLVKQAFADRKMAELEARQAALEERMKAYENQAPEIKIHQMPTPDGNPDPSPTPSPNPNPNSSPFNYQPQH